MIIQKNHLAIAMSLAGVVGLGATVVHAVDFTATATVENTVTVANLQDLDFGTIFALTSSGWASGGVAALVLDPTDGSMAEVVGGDSTDVNIISLSDGTPGQGSVEVASNFTLTFPNTTGIDPAVFPGGGAAIDAAGGTATGAWVELENQAAIGNAAIAKLYVANLTVADVSGGVFTPGTADIVGGSAADYDGTLPIVMGFNETTYVFNIGGTIMTQPTDSTDGTGDLPYEAGIYSGSFVVEASY